ncbi:HAMP domain-containing sensor histidine kinase [Nocardioides aquiterrae]|uniref:histidine kinase n=1 Tax=Nocardioides aquiterrae TaxID=203799 RepID=A0ABP4F1J1_9ACTN
MRRRILVVALSAVLLAVLLLGVPLAVAIQRDAVGEERGELERAALTAATAVSPSYRTGDPVELPAVTAPIEVSLYDPAGHLVTGPGARELEAARLAARTGRVEDADHGDVLAEAVPVSVDEEIIGVVVASSPRADLHATLARRFLGLTALGLVAFAGAGVFAYWQARRLTRPMRELARAATRMGAGDLGARAERSGVPEIDETADALATTAVRLSAFVDRERSFSARASHQLRTPLTRLRLELEAGMVSEALATADHLSQVVDDVLAVTREPAPHASGFAVEPVLADVVDAWHGTFALDGRPLRLRVDAGLTAGASEAAVRQVLQVLLDNAYRHGAGAVTVTGREASGVVAIDVVDRGGSPVPWPPAESGGRMGLALARTLARSQRGRLLLSQDEDGTRFTLLVPRSGAEQVDPGTVGP